jgi:PhnB protein
MKLNPYLNFDGTCQDAMETYAKILGGEILTLMRFDEMPGDQGFPPEMAKKIAHARLKIGESILMASHAQGPYAPMQGTSITLNIPEPEKAEAAYNALLQGGNSLMPLEETFWAHKFGMLTDRFGTRWMVNCEKPGDWS